MQWNILYIIFIVFSISLDTHINSECLISENINKQSLQQSFKVS